MYSPLIWPYSSFQLYYRVEKGKTCMKMLIFFVATSNFMDVVG